MIPTDCGPRRMLEGLESDEEEVWWRTFTNATFRLVNVESEDPVHSRSRYGWQVCFARWLYCCIEDCKEFGDVLKHAMPAGTKIYGCKDFDWHYAVLAFPRSFRSWRGLREHLRLKCRDGKDDTAVVTFFVLQEGNDVAQWIEWMHQFCDAGEVVFGENFVEGQLKRDEVDSHVILGSAGDMWITSQEELKEKKEEGSKEMGESS